MAKKKDEVPMVVIAKRDGLYGDKPRRPGERFPIKGETAFSKKWMLDVNDPASQREIRKLEALYVPPGGKQDVDDETLLSEMRQSMGELPALRQENVQLKARLAAMEKQQVNVKEDEDGGEDTDQAPEGEGNNAGGPGESDEAAASEDVSSRPASKRRRPAQHPVEG